MQDIVKETIGRLSDNHMAGYYTRSISQLHELLKRLMPEGQTVGCGDSVTLEQTGVLEYVRNHRYNFLDKHIEGLSHEQKREIYLLNFRADTFLTGINAVTVNGELFNIDGNGSRVAPILYGPKQVIAIVGTNKIVKSVDDAILRTRQIAAPLDAKRLGKETPCTKLDRCIDCHHSQRICNDFVLITGQFEKERIKVIFIEGNFGY
ncbi:MAG: lactate utilization protein [Clostridiaceae bacterium]|nr:lactate utilization protein [Clostridiaceae bacterium]